jgi:hypothetical protein
VWLLFLLRPAPSPTAEGDDLEFPGSLILVALGVAYLVAAIALPIALYRDRNASRGHSVAYYASLGILGLCATLIWKAQ